jgi:hypothetical protein
MEENKKNISMKVYVATLVYNYSFFFLSAVYYNSLWINLQSKGEHT